MKKFIALLLIGILLISCSGCDKTPKGEDDSEVAMSEADDGVDMKREADDSVDMKRENNTLVIETVPEAKKVQPKQPENKKEQEPYNLNYTVKHDDSDYIPGYTGDDMPQFPKVYVINSVQKLSQVIEGKSASYKFAEKIKYREKTDSTAYDYSKAKQEASIKEYYNDAFFENKILVIVISKLKDYDLVADLSYVKSDGTVQIDLLNSNSCNYRPYNYSCCEYIELNKKYARLDFKIKYNEVPIKTSMETRDLLPNYPHSIDFKSKQISASQCGCETGQQCCHKAITVITSVEKLQNYMNTTKCYYWDDQVTSVYDYSKEKRITYRYFDVINDKNISSASDINFPEYYNKEFFKTKCVLVIMVAIGDGSDYQVRSVTSDGTITFENYVPSYTSNDMKYSFEFIEIDRKYMNTKFKAEFVELNKYEYLWNK